VVNENSSLFSTKVNIDLLDCYNTIIFSTEEARSKEKDFKKAYHEAIRKTFVEIEELNYAYNNTPVNTSKKELKTTKVVVIPKKVQVPKIEKVENLNKTTPVIKSKKVSKKPTEQVKKSPLKIVKKPTTIEGKFNIDNWGICEITKKENHYSVIGGDENFEFATIYKTSKPNIFIIKWAAYKQPQLLEIDTQGNLKVDTKNGIKVYKRIL